MASKLIALDLDGTVVDYDGSIDAALAVYLRGLCNDPEIELMIATGRGVNGALDVVQLAEITPEWVICANGALTLQRDESARSGYAQEHVVTFNTSEVLELIRPHFYEAHYIVETGMGETLHTGLQIDSAIHAAHHEVGFEDLIGIDASRIVVYSPDHALDEFLKVVERIGLSHVNYTIGHTSWLDIAPAGVGKESAIARLNERFGIPMQNVLVAGDGDNDRGMLTWARDGGATAVVMGQAPDAVKACGNMITAPVTENGLLQALQTWLAR